MKKIIDYAKKIDHELGKIVLPYRGSINSFIVGGMIAGAGLFALEHLDDITAYAVNKVCVGTERGIDSYVSGKEYKVFPKFIDIIEMKKGYKK